MLDELELSNKLGIPTFKDLFESQSHLLHSTSILKYPVFISHKNYNGNNPRLLDSTILWNSVKTEFLEEIKDFENTLIIPLGKRVDNIFQNLGIQEKLTSNRILHNFPHPSGANGHRVKQFNLYKNDLKKTVKAWN